MLLDAQEVLVEIYMSGWWAPHGLKEVSLDLGRFVIMRSYPPIIPFLKSLYEIVSPACVGSTVKEFGVGVA